MITTITKTFQAEDGYELDLALSEQDLRDAKRALMNGRATTILDMSPLNKVAGSEFQAVDRSWVIEAHLDGFDLLLIAQRPKSSSTWISRVKSAELI